MREPHRFPRALSGVMIVVTVLFATAGIMGYAAYGSKIQTVVIVNLPQEDKFVQAVQFLCEFGSCSTFHSLSPPCSQLNGPCRPCDLTQADPYRLDRYPPLHPPPALPCCSYHGERYLLPIGQTQRFGQVAKEHV